LNAKKILTTHRKELDRLANALLEYETLDLEEIKIVLNGGDIISYMKQKEAREQKLKQEAIAAQIQADHDEWLPNPAPTK
jgi:hypothetical protein